MEISRKGGVLPSFARKPLSLSLSLCLSHIYTYSLVLFLIAFANYSTDEMRVSRKHGFVPVNLHEAARFLFPNAVAITRQSSAIAYLTRNDARLIGIPEWPGQARERKVELSRWKRS